MRLLVFSVDLDITTTLFDELVVVVETFSRKSKEFIEVVVGAEVAVSYGFITAYFESRLRVVVLLLSLYAETSVFKHSLLVVFPLFGVVESAQTFLLVKTNFC